MMDQKLSLFIKDFELTLDLSRSRKLKKHDKSESGLGCTQSCSEFYLLHTNTTCLKGWVKQFEHRYCMYVSMEERKER